MKHAPRSSLSIVGRFCSLLMGFLLIAGLNTTSFAGGTLTVQIASCPSSVAPGELVTVKVRILFSGDDNDGPWQVTHISLRDDDIWPAYNTIANVNNPFLISSQNVWYTNTFTNIRLSDWDDGGNGIEVYGEAEVDDNDFNGYNPSGSSSIFQVGVKPTKATSANPATGAAGQSINVDTSWANGGGASSYDVYFGTDSTPDSGELIGNRTTTSYDPGTLAYSTTYYWRIDAKNYAGTTTGDVWSFTTQAQPLPSKATSPSPVNGATSQSINVDVSWANGGGATSYDLYFGTDSTPDSGELIGNRTTTSYDPGTLAYSTTYYWRIDAKNAAGTTTGDVWSFTTQPPPPPSKATSPSPANGATGQSISVDISWVNGGGATSYDVYFGTDSTPDSGELVGNQTGTSYDPGSLAYSTTYYWRIDAKNAGGTTTGDVWSFTTVAEPAAPKPSNPNPASGSTSHPLDLSFSWQSGGGTTARYDVWLGTSAGGLTRVSTDQTGTSYTPSARQTGTTYYWRVDAKNSAGSATTGDVWSFTTCGNTSAGADRGNTTAQEYGDALYDNFDFLNLGYNYNHAGLCAGIDSAGVSRIFESSAGDEPADPNDTPSSGPQEGKLYESFLIEGANYYGAYIPSTYGGTMPFADRRAVVAKAKEAVDDAGIAYPIVTLNAINYDAGWTAPLDPNEITDLRCDGLVEYAFERSGIRVWRNCFEADSEWNISYYPAHHNNNPGNTRDPHFEMSPWAQRGAPPATGPTVLGSQYSGPPWPDTKMTKTSPITLPTCQIIVLATTTDYVDLQVRATDESGIYQVTHTKPDGDGPQQYKVNPERHPTADTWTTPTIRYLRLPGNTYYPVRVAAQDHGANWGNVVGADVYFLPYKATTPAPSSGSANRPINQTLSWVNGGGATSYDVYFGTDSTPDSTEFVGNQSGTTYNPGALANGTTFYWRIDSKNSAGTTTGDVWSFTTAAAPPSKATTPTPANLATDQSINVDVSWSNGGGATSYDVYFGTDATPDSGELRGNQAGTSFDPGILAYSTTYYWRIDAVNAGGTTTGDVWSFTTAAAPPQPPSKATTPSPDNPASDQSINVDVSWSNGGGATSYDVYFGTDATPDSGELRGNQTATTFDPGTLAYSTTYYWRIDAVNTAGTTTGDVWSFTTTSPNPPAAPTINNPKLIGTTFTLSVPTQVGFNYTLEYKNALSDANWTAVQTLGGNGGTITLTDTGATNSRRLYRVRVQ